MNKRLVIALAGLLLAGLLLAGSCWAAADDVAAGGEPNGAPKDKDEKKGKKDKSPKQSVSSSVKTTDTGLPRIWIGLTGSITPLKLFKVGSDSGLQDGTTGSQQNMTTAQGFVGGGVTLNARVYHHFWLSVGGIYRFGGYDWLFQIYDTNANIYDFTERTRISMVDIPVLVRYDGKKWNANKHTFYELGASYRDVLSRKQSTEYFCCASSANLGASPYDSGALERMKKHSIGAVAGAGFWAKDDFGIIVSPEVRYTRWMNETFHDPGYLSTQRNQLEVTISFGF